MDGSHFDALVRTLATTRLTRLTALRGLAVGAVAAAIGLADPDDAAAKCKKKCGECKKKKRRKTNSGKVRCRCKAKANGTPCSTGTCQSGTCVAAPRPPIPPAPPGFDCRVSGCTGQFAGLVCDPNTGQCVFCENFTQCPGNRLCLNGRCLADVGCDNDPDCANVLGGGIEEMICNDSNENSEAPDDVCILEPTRYFGACDEDNDCDSAEAIFPGIEFSCVEFTCVIDCRDEGQEDCDAFSNMFPVPGPWECVGGACLREAP
jgi:hypothetical protein